MAQWGSDARREWDRQVVDAEVEVNFPRPNWGTLVDISPAGYCLLLEWPLAPGERCIARVINGTGVHLLPAVVSWVREDGDRYRTGLSFHDV